MRGYIRGFVCFSVLIFSGAAFAQGSGQWGAFTLHNNSEYTIAAFYTNEGSGWSRNWLSEQIGPGEAIDLEFNDKSGPCEADFKVSWVGHTSNVVEDWSGDFCQITNLYLGNTDATFD